MLIMVFSWQSLLFQKLDDTNSRYEESNFHSVTKCLNGSSIEYYLTFFEDATDDNEFNKKGSTRLWIEKKVLLLVGLPDGMVVDLGCRV
jgi:hypothetical protein